MTAGRQTGHGSDKETQTPDEAAPKRLVLHLKQKGTAEPPLRMQKQPQLPYSMIAPSNYRRKWGSSTPHREELLQQHFRDNGRLGDSNRHHTLLHLTPVSPTALPLPLVDRGEKRPLP